MELNLSVQASRRETTIVQSKSTFSNPTSFFYGKEELCFRVKFFDPMISEKILLRLGNNVVKEYQFDFVNCSLTIKLVDLFFIMNLAGSFPYFCRVKYFFDSAEDLKKIESFFKYFEATYGEVGR